MANKCLSQPELHQNRPAVPDERRTSLMSPGGPGLLTCTEALAWMGASIAKVEPPRGEAGRTGFGDAFYFIKDADALEEAGDSGLQKTASGSPVNLGRYARERAIRRRGAYWGMGCSAHIRRRTATLNEINGLQVTAAAAAETAATNHRINDFHGLAGTAANRRNRRIRPRKHTYSPCASSRLRTRRVLSSPFRPYG
jgi:hypothetical protein